MVDIFGSGSKSDFELRKLSRSDLDCISSESEKSILRDILQDLQQEMALQKDYYSVALRELKDGALDSIVEKETQIETLKSKIDNLVVFTEQRRATFNQKDLKVQSKLGELYELEDMMKRSIESNKNNNEFIKQKHMSFLKTQMEYEHDIVEYRSVIRDQENRIKLLNIQLQDRSNKEKQMDSEQINLIHQIQSINKQNDLKGIQTKQELQEKEQLIFDLNNQHHQEYNNFMIEISEKNNTITQLNKKIKKLEVQMYQSGKTYEQIMKDYNNLQHEYNSILKENETIKLEYMNIRSEFMKEKPNDNSTYDGTTLDFQRKSDHGIISMYSKIFLLRVNTFMQTNMLPTNFLMSVFNNNEQNMVKKVYNYILPSEEDEETQDLSFVDKEDNEELKQLRKKIQNQDNLIQYYEKKYQKYKALKQKIKN